MHLYCVVGKIVGQESLLDSYHKVDYNRDNKRRCDKRLTLLAKELEKL